MAQSFTGKKRIRFSFGRIPEAVQMPNLIEVQRSSYEQFLQREVLAGERRDEGIEAVFKSVFPIKDFNERAILEYVSYEFEEPKYDVEECVQRDMTYAAPLKVERRLIDFEFDAKDIVYVRIDRRRKLPATTFLMALGMDGEEILSTFYKTVAYEKTKTGWSITYIPERWRGVKPEFPLIDAESGEEIAPS